VGVGIPGALFGTIFRDFGGSASPIFVAQS